MCLLAYKPRGVALPDEVIRGGARANKDGWGIAAILDDGKVHVERGLDFDKDQSSLGLSAFDTIRYFDGQEAVVHFRANSKGATSIENTHPIWTGNGEIYLAHNGTLRGWGDPQHKKGISDTFELAKTLGEILQEGQDVTQDLKLWKLVEKIIETSRVALICPSGVRIFNRKEGFELENGIWVSNKTYLSYNYAYEGWVDDPDWRERWNDTTTRLSILPLPHNRVHRATGPSLRKQTRKVCAICHDCGHTDCANNKKQGCNKGKTLSKWHIIWCKLSSNHELYCEGLNTYSERDGVVMCLDCADFSDKQEQVRLTDD